MNKLVKISVYFSDRNKELLNKLVNLAKNNDEGVSKTVIRILKTYFNDNK